MPSSKSDGHASKNLISKFWNVLNPQKNQEAILRKRRKTKFRKTSRAKKLIKNLTFARFKYFSFFTKTRQQTKNWVCVNAFYKVSLFRAWCTQFLCESVVCAFFLSFFVFLIVGQNNAWEWLHLFELYHAFFNSDFLRPLVVSMTKFYHILPQRERGNHFCHSNSIF